ncbi:family 2 glycosyl transferase [Gracilibacillus halophilus YIM-C55.5]|uniref:Family 2 glycosyl transferase n=1 Tax=Gracilibacillus halophilus YIM-C55.5 TaxID=1308866 RepID=N4WDQ2_9BACI|nr:glycosyltransferase [Gracilibacillus halophilus]ENH98398.1 family 2 glycosyl transferase [Gracilibacillus halophilus YIM-C55.5]
MQLSIAMMVKNEGEHLERCLQSLVPIMEAVESELIIVDTGSDDNTVDIARKYTDKVYFHQWNDHFSEIRNITINYSSGEWIFTIDGDEFVYNPEPIIEFFNSQLHKQYNTVLLDIRNITTYDKQIEFERNNDILHKLTGQLTKKIFRNTPDFHFKGAIHNQPQAEKPYVKIDSFLVHFGYMSTDPELMEKKFQRTARILKQELDNDPWNVYYWFQLSVSYAMHKEPKKALDCAIKAYDTANELNYDFSKRMYLYVHFAAMYLQNKMYQELENLCVEGLNVADGYMDLYYYLAISHFEQGKNQSAIQYFKKYLAINENYEDSIGYMDTTVIEKSIDSRDSALKALIILYDREEMYEDLINLVYDIELDTLKDVMSLIVNAYISIGEYRELIKYENYLIDNNMMQDLHLALERYYDTLKTNNKEEFLKGLLDLNSNYSKLCKARLYLLEQKDCDKSKIQELIMNIDFQYAPNYYGDIIYLSLVNNININFIVNSIRENKINEYFEFISDNHESVERKIYNYLTYYRSTDRIQDLRLNKSLAKYGVILGETNFSEEEYQYIFFRYIKEGIHYLKNLYNDEMLSYLYTSHVKNNEEAFLIYIMNAFNYKEEDQLKYVQYLKSAINEFPIMAKGVKLMLDRQSFITEDNHNSHNSLNKLRFEIEDKISQGEITEAKRLLIEYNKYSDDHDPNLQSMKGIIAMVEGKYYKSLELFEKANKIDDENLDILYNLGYVYYMLNDYTNAVTILKKCYKYAEDEELIKDINGLFVEMKVIEDNEPLENTNDLSQHKLTDVDFRKQQTKLVFFSKGDDKFSQDIIDYLSTKFDVRKIVVKDTKQIDEGMHWLIFVGLNGVMS